MDDYKSFFLSLLFCGSYMYAGTWLQETAYNANNTIGIITTIAFVTFTIAIVVGFCVYGIPNWVFDAIDYVTDSFYDLIQRLKGGKVK